MKVTLQFAWIKEEQVLDILLFFLPFFALLPAITLECAALTGSEKFKGINIFILKYHRSSTMESGGVFLNLRSFKCKKYHLFLAK